MPFALILVGLLLVVAAVRNTVTDNSTTGTKGLTTLIKGDFTGQNNFIYWMVSILIIGALGYIDSLKSLSRVFMALIVVALFLKGNQGTSFFSNFQSALSNLGQGDFGGSLSSLIGSNPTPSTSSTPATSATQSLDQLNQQALQDALQQYSAAAAQGIPGTAAKAQAAQNALNLY